MIPEGLLFFFYFIVFNTQRHVIINLWKAKRKEKNGENLRWKVYFLGNGKSNAGESDFLLFLFFFFIKYFSFTLIYNRNQKSLKAFPSLLILFIYFVPIETIANGKTVSCSNWSNLENYFYSNILFMICILILSSNCDNLFT